MRFRPLLRTLKSGDTRGRIAALRSSNQAVKVAVLGSAVRTGVLDELSRGPVTTAELAVRRSWSAESVVEAFLRVLQTHGLVRETDRGWVTTRQGRRIVGDDVVRATYEAFSGYHTLLYRDIEQQLAGATRDDIERDGQLIARLSRFMDEFVLAELESVVAVRQPTRVLDVGCGAAAHLVRVLQSAPGATAVGVETDRAAAVLARRAIEAERVADRAEIVEADVRSFLADRPDQTFDLVVLANVIYYVPPAERITLLSALAARLDVGGRVVLVTTALTDDTFSRHFDLLLRTQSGAMELPDLEQLTAQLRGAGLTPDAPRRIAPGEPLTAIVAHRTAG